MVPCASKTGAAEPLLLLPPAALPRCESGVPTIQSSFVEARTGSGCDSAKGTTPEASTAHGGSGPTGATLRALAAIAHVTQIKSCILQILECSFLCEQTENL